MATVVALDTSALMLPVEVDIRLFDELERLLGAVDPIVPAAVQLELGRLAEAGGRDGRAARVGLTLAQSRCRAVSTDATPADDAVLELATGGSAAYLVTADRALRDRALQADVPVVGPRAGQRLVVHRP